MSMFARRKAAHVELDAGQRVAVNERCVCRLDLVEHSAVGMNLQPATNVPGGCGAEGACSNICAGGVDGLLDEVGFGLEEIP